ncbi:MAG TPA: lipid-A-disaccharide synthase [Bryobacteraceae bacterium]|nr:lipid-A-disaccharide synthase [Bryobacteraceae bacterium]
MSATVLISAGEASGDRYAADLACHLRKLHPELTLFGCTGDRMAAAGVETVVDAASLAVVGLAEVVSHIPRIYGEYRKLLRATDERRPRLAILTDSPDFHLRLARQLRRRGVPVVYLVAPQVWAWRQGRVRQMRRDLTQLLCIFPFEEPWFQERGVRATWIGHPLVHQVSAKTTRSEFFRRHGLSESRPFVPLLPGSRRGEASRHVPHLVDAASRMPGVQFAFAMPSGFLARAGEQFFRERNSPSSIQVFEGETSDALAHADVALAASGTVTVEAALLGTPMVTFYRVSPLSWLLGRRLVRVPFLTMVNLLAGRSVVPELMQDEATGERLSGEVLRLLGDEQARNRMKQDLASVAATLRTSEHPMQTAAEIASRYLD